MAQQPPITVTIPGVGDVDFPSTMSQSEINAASKRLYDQKHLSAAPAPRLAAQPGAVSRFLSAASAPFVGAVKGLDPRPTPEETRQGFTSPYDYILRPFERVAEGGIEQGKEAGQAFKSSAPLSLHPTDQQLANRQLAVGHALAAAIPGIGPWAANAAQRFGEQAGTGDVAGAAGTAVGNAAMALAPKAIIEGTVKAFPQVGEILSKKYAPRAIEVVGEKVPVTVGEAEPESPAGRLQTRLKRSGASPEKFGKVEAAQQEAVKNVIRKTAQQTSDLIGPISEEPGAAMADATTATFNKGRAMYQALDDQLKGYRAPLDTASKIVQSAIDKARKLGVDVGGTEDISKIRPDKDGTIQWGGSRISKASNPERWNKLVSDGIIDESGNGTPLAAYKSVYSQLLKMQRAASDEAVRFQIGQQIKSMDANMQDALKGTPIYENWKAADHVWAKAYALRDVADAITKDTKGTPAAQQAPGLASVPTKIQGKELVGRLNTLADDGILDKAFTPEEAKNLRQSADILDRIQRTPIGQGFGESMSRSRGLAHAISGAKGPVIGAGVGMLLGHGFVGAEFGAGIGFIVQAIGERALVGVMTKLDGVKALESLADAKTPVDAQSATKTIVALASAGQQRYPVLPNTGGRPQDKRQPAPKAPGSHHSGQALGQ